MWNPPTASQPLVVDPTPTGRDGSELVQPIPQFGPGPSFSLIANPKPSSHAPPGLEDPAGFDPAGFDPPTNSDPNSQDGQSGGSGSSQNGDAPIPNGIPSAIITVGSSTITARHSGIVLPPSTLSLGSPIGIVSGHTISLGGGEIVVDGATTSFSNLGEEKGLGAVITVGSSVLTAGPTGLVLPPAALSSRGPASFVTHYLSCLERSRG